MATSYTCDDPSHTEIERVAATTQVKVWKLHATQANTHETTKQMDSCDEHIGVIASGLFMSNRRDERFVKIEISKR